MSSIEIPSVIPKPIEDCVELHRAFHGIGCDGATVIDILAHRPVEHRAAMKDVYRNMYQEEICARLKSELHNHFEKAVLLWMRDSASRDARVLRDAMRVRGPQRKNMFVEAICLRCPTERQLVTEAYKSEFDRSLLLDVKSATDGSFQKLLEAYLIAVPEENDNLSSNEVQEEAEKLYSAGEGRSTVDHDVFINFLSSRTRGQLLAILDSYKDLYGHEVFKGLKTAHGNSSDVFVNELKDVMKCVSNPARYFAKVLRKSMKGLGTDDNTLIRVVVTRSEIDMTNIKLEYIRKYKLSLEQTIASDTSGNYRRFLLSLIGSVAAKDKSFFLKRHL